MPSPIRDAVADVEGMREQESEHLNPFKQSYYVEHDKNDAVLKKVDERVKGKFDEVIIYSFDSQDGKGCWTSCPPVQPSRLPSNMWPRNSVPRKRTLYFAVTAATTSTP